MKKLLAAAFLLAMSFMTHSATDTNEDYCKNLHQLADNIMFFRQDGVSVIKQMELVESTKPTKDFKRLMEMMIEKAYKEPKFGSEEYKAEAITEFANDIYIRCKQANRSK